MEFKKDYAKYYDLFNQNKNYLKECDFLEEIFRRYSERKVKKILDLGCGTGMHDVELVKRGYNITGLDLSEEMIEIAKSREKNAKFVVGDMSKFDLNEKYDVIVCMFSSIGYLLDNKQLEGFFESVKSNLEEDGLLVIDCWNGLGVMKDNPTSREKISEVNDIKIVRKSFPKMSSKDHKVDVIFEVKVFENDNIIEDYKEEHNVRFFFPKEIEKYMKDSDFELIKLCPSYNLDEELNENHWNMVFVAKNK